MPEIEMPPQYAGTYPDPHDTEGHVRRAIANTAARRLQGWTMFVLEAITRFESHANRRIEELEYNFDATYSFNPVLESFATAVMGAFPQTAAATSILSGVMEGIHASYAQTLEKGLSDAKARLRASVAALAETTRESTTRAASQISAKLANMVDDAMTWVDSASTDDDYLNAFCDWMGFPEPTDANTINPVRQALENPFFGVYQAVRAQLIRTAGVPGLDADQFNPAAWEHEAVVHQRDLYDGGNNPPAWEKVYDELH